MILEESDMDIKENEEMQEEALPLDETVEAELTDSEDTPAEDLESTVESIEPTGDEPLQDDTEGVESSESDLEITTEDDASEEDDPEIEEVLPEEELADEDSEALIESEVEIGETEDESLETEGEDIEAIETEEELALDPELDQEADLQDSDVMEEAAELVEDQEDTLEDDEISEKPLLKVSDKDDGRAWYVVHCYSGNEDKVRHNIVQRIESMSMDDLVFDVVVPTEDEVNIKNGERQTIEKKVFPGYILVNMILSEESWYMVRNTPGVTGFVGMGNDPTPLQPEEVARILKRMESESPRINVTFRPGERVRIVDGPFEDFYGKVSEIDMERATVRVMVNFFGRETPVELDFLQVEEA
jgi:transcriptional antiterminator NusG